MHNRVGVLMRKFSVDEIGNYIADDYWENTGNWHPPLLGATISVNITSLTAANQALVKLALMAWSELGFKFTFSGSTNADILMTDDFNGAYTDWVDRQGRPLINVGPDFTAAGGSDFDGYTYQTWLHEIGHSLGLGHTGAYNGIGTYGVDNVFTNDSWQMSVMSYFPQDENSSIDASFAYVLTPMPGDIAGIEQLYDLDAEPGKGNTVYLWGTNATGIHGVIGRELQAGRLDEPVTMTIMDHSGVDTLNFAGSNQAVKLDLRPGSINSALGLKGNILIERGTMIERANGSSTHDVIRGQQAGNLLDGRAGNDVLDGREGNDLLRGGTGNDTLIGGTGNDVLHGQSGADRLDGGSGRDTARFDSVATTVDLAVQSRNAGGAAGDRLISIERIEGGNRTDHLSGDRFHNLLSSAGGNDVLNGRAGNDTLLGGANGDTLLGGDGNDILVGGSGGDRLNGGAGRDVAYYTGGAVTVDLARQNLNTGDARGDVLYSIEDINGSAGHDRLRGDRFNNILSGKDGNDVLDGRNGNDTLNGDNGNDLLVGGGGNDRLFGGAGNDRLVSQSGSDTVWGGLGADDFEFWGGQLRIVDFQNDVDELVLNRAQLGLSSGTTIDDILDIAQVINGDTQIRLGNGQLVILYDVDNVNELANDLILI